jgi:glycosyltransferase involved in cell wall biosynthesis
MPITVSVVTVCRNSSASIAKTMNSIAEQIGVNVQHIIIDGASTDGTQDIVLNSAQPNVIFFSEPDNGIYDAMNKGIARATGDIVALLNADDHYAHSSVLRNVVQHFSTKFCDVVFGDVGFFKSNRPEKIIRRYDSSRFSPLRIGFGIMPAHPATFLKRDIYERFGVFRTDYRIAADFEFVARIFKQNDLRFHYMDEVLVKMQTGGVSTRGIRSRITLNQEILRACKENSINSSPFHLACKIPFRLLELIKL